ncbi:MAG: flagellar biosynthetic protein FliO [Oceanospirillaceae bacterium]|nr:flagellar biosynthetic protein FliO [Oceanospirillaceae bacterium]
MNCKQSLRTAFLLLIASVSTQNFGVELSEKLTVGGLQSQLLDTSSLGSSIWQMALGLALVLLVIFGLSWLMRRVTGIQGSKAHIKIISAVNVGAKERAVLIEVGGEQLLLGVASGQVSLLHKLPVPINIQAAKFSDSLKKASVKLSRQSTAAKPENSV